MKQFFDIPDKFIPVLLLFRNLKKKIPDNLTRFTSPDLQVLSSSIQSPLLRPDARKGRTMNDCEIQGLRRHIPFGW